MQRVGVNPGSKVVLYDHKYDATRLWWAFYYYGKTDVRVLDGGIKAWKDAGYPTDLFSFKDPARGTWIAKITYPFMRVDTADILALRSLRMKPSFQLFMKDVLSSPRSPIDQDRTIIQNIKIPGSKLICLAIRPVQSGCNIIPPAKWEYLQSYGKVQIS